jgi:hypothetical protein
MPEELRLWRIEGGESLREITRAPLELESRPESWLERDISILDRDLLVIGRQVETDFGGIIDLLCLDHAGDLVVVELKPDKTPREITPQALDYGSWFKDLSDERIRSIAGRHLAPRKLDEAFKQRFGTEIPETLNENHRMLIVASEIEHHQVPVGHLRGEHQRRHVPLLQGGERRRTTCSDLPHRA